jgi:hypothetical protein
MHTIINGVIFAATDRILFGFLLKNLNSHLPFFSPIYASKNMNFLVTLSVNGMKKISWLFATFFGSDMNEK